MLDKVKNTSKCYGFVNFASEEDAAKAIAGLNNKMIGEKRLTVQVKRAKRCSCLLQTSAQGIHCFQLLHTREILVGGEEAIAEDLAGLLLLLP